MTEDDYLEIMRAILVAEPCTNCTPNDPSLIMDRLYLGSQRNAETWATLERLGVTHVLNCAGFKGQRSYEGSPYDDVGIEYWEFQADDHDDYDITKHFNEAFCFIDKARQKGGIVLVHCALGINRSGATVIAYLMSRGNTPLLKTIKTIKSKRRVLLSNRGFQKRLVKFAKKLGLLDDLTDENDHDDLRKFIRKKILNKPRSSSLERKEQEEDIDAFIERCRPKKERDEFGSLNTDKIANISNNHKSDKINKIFDARNDGNIVENEKEERDNNELVTNRQLITKYRSQKKVPQRRPQSQLFEYSTDGYKNGISNFKQIEKGLEKIYPKIYSDYYVTEPYKSPYTTDYHQPIPNYYQPPIMYTQPQLETLADYRPQTTFDYQSTNNNNNLFYQPNNTQQIIGNNGPNMVTTYTNGTLPPLPSSAILPRHKPKIQIPRRAENLEQVPVYRGNNIEIFCTPNSAYNISVSVPQRVKVRRSMSLSKINQPSYYY